MLVCNFCGAIKNEEDLKTYTQIHDYTDLQPLKERVVDYSCDECGRGDYVKATECKICGSWFDDEDLVGVCESCLEDEETFENAVKLGRENTESREINGFLASLFSAEKINDILEQYAEQHFTDHCTEIVHYCEEDKRFFADLIVENHTEDKRWLA